MLPLDTELEKTLRNLKKVRIDEALVMAKHRETHQNIPAVAAERPQRQRTMEDFWRPIIKDEYSAVRKPTIEANNFELKPALITMVQQLQYTEHPSEDPTEHLGRFLRMENTMKLNGVNLDVIKLQLFPFSLRDVAATWFESLPYRSMITWEEVVEAYLSRFFPPVLTSEGRRKLYPSSRKMMNLSSMLGRDTSKYLEDAQCMA